MTGGPDATLRKLTGYRLQRATSAAMLRYKAVFARFGLRRTTFSCLALIVASPGLRQGQLGEVLSIERPNLGGIVDDLTRSGLVRRDVSPTDKRAYALVATDHGRRVFDEAQQAVETLDRDIAQGLTDEEVAALHRALAQVQSNAESG